MLAGIEIAKPDEWYILESVIGDVRFRQVEGVAFADIEWFDGFIYHPMPHRWGVTDGVTGCWVAIESNRSLAITVATMQLTRMGREVYEAEITKYLRACPFSPRYRWTLEAMEAECVGSAAMSRRSTGRSGGR